MPKLLIGDLVWNLHFQFLQLHEYPRHNLQDMWEIIKLWTGKFRIAVDEQTDHWPQNLKITKEKKKQTNKQTKFTFKIIF